MANWGEKTQLIFPAPWAPTGCWGLSGGAWISSINRMWPPIYCIFPTGFAKKMSPCLLRLRIFNKSPAWGWTAVLFSEKSTLLFTSFGDVLVVVNLPYLPPLNKKALFNRSFWEGGLVRKRVGWPAMIFHGDMNLPKFAPSWHYKSLVPNLFSEMWVAGSISH